MLLDTNVSRDLKKMGYEQEEGVVSWGAQYLEKFLSNIGGARMSIGFVPSGEFQEEARGFETPDK